MKKEFDGEVWKTGKSHVVTIPHRIIKKAKIKPGDSLKIIVEKEEK